MEGLRFWKFLVLSVLIYGLALVYILDQPEQRQVTWMLPSLAGLGILVVCVAHIGVDWFSQKAMNTRMLVILAICLAVYLLLQSAWGWEDLDENPADAAFLPVYVLTVAASAFIHLYPSVIPPVVTPIASPSYLDNVMAS